MAPPLQPSITILQACLDVKLFAPWFKNPADWENWFAFLATVFGLPFLDKKLGVALYEECTNRDASKRPKKPYREAWLAVGRRGGKSRVLALIAVYLACFWEWRDYLSPGERAVIVVIATDRKQARVIFRYIEAFLLECKMLDPLVGRRTAEVIDLKNHVSIEVHTASFRGVRGSTIVAALCDEMAFWRNEDSTNPDYEILNAIRPGMMTIPGSMMLCCSSPYARKGELWNNYKNYYGKEDDDILMWKAPSWVMNPTLPKSFIDREYKRDLASAKAEYGAEFRSDVEIFVRQEAVDQCVVSGRYELPPINDLEYWGFVDPSGGSADSFTLGVAHRLPRSDVVVLDCLREFKPPFSPAGVISEISSTVRKYKLDRVFGDRYGGEFPRERFDECGVLYLVSDRTKSDIYAEMLPLINSAQCELLDDTDMINQLLSLERKTSRAGKDSIDHPPGGHDDIINAGAGALVLASENGPAEVW